MKGFQPVCKFTLFRHSFPLFLLLKCLPRYLLNTPNAGQIHPQIHPGSWIEYFPGSEIKCFRSFSLIFLIFYLDFPFPDFHRFFLETFPKTNRQTDYSATWVHTNFQVKSRILRCEIGNLSKKLDITELSSSEEQFSVLNLLLVGFQEVFH